MARAGEVPECDGWKLEFPIGAKITDDARARLIRGAIAAAAGRSGAPIRRSRYAATYVLGVAGIAAFVKVYDSPDGRGIIKRAIRGSRAAYAARASEALLSLGFNVPRIILYAEEAATGRTMIMTERVRGISLAAYLGERADQDGASACVVLRALGAEVARLHRAGYIHGDLTPHNVFLAGLKPPSFVFIDHDRTRNAFAIGRRRRQLRNLVQLLRFDLPRLTGEGRRIMVEAWAEGLDLQKRDSIMHRAFDMLKLRIEKDMRKQNGESARGPAASTPAPSSRAASRTG